MERVLIVLALIALFYLIGKAADLIVSNVRAITERLGVGVFFGGILLGLLTSLPEFSIGINALANGVASISLGNLLGGTLVLFSFILGLSAILNRRIKTDGKPEGILPTLIYLVIPVLLALDGTIGIVDGMLLVVLYFALIYVLYVGHPLANRRVRTTARPPAILAKVFKLLGGMAAVILISNVIVTLTLRLLAQDGISPFATGLLAFSLGTNLPEIIVTVRSWQRNVRDLSFGNLIGSAITNPLIIGVFAIMKEFRITVDVSFIFYGAFSLGLFAVVYQLYRSGSKFTRNEGIVLMALYAAFLVGQIFFSIIISHG